MRRRLAFLLAVPLALAGSAWAQQAPPTVGITTDRLETLDIVLHLPTIGAAQADDPPHLASIDKGHVVQDARLRSKRNHAQLFAHES